VYNVVQTGDFISRIDAQSHSSVAPVSTANDPDEIEEGVPHRHIKETNIYIYIKNITCVIF
jgi:hypothetical protein